MIRQEDRSSPFIHNTMEYLSLLILMVQIKEDEQILRSIIAI